MFSKEELQNGLKTKTFGHKLFVFEKIDSTNACAKTLAEAGTEEGATVIAEFQTEGRGRFGRPWQAEPGENLLFSSVLRPTVLKDNSSLLTYFAAVSVARAVEKASSCSLECKWPNDLYLNGKKFCGILLENSFKQSSLDYSVVGVGLNVNQRTFNEQLADRATSLAQELNVDIDRKELFQRILQEMETLYESVKEGDFSEIIRDWNKRCKMFGKQITVRGGKEELTGTAVRLSDDGGLMLETSGGLRTVYAGDATIVR